MHELLAAIPGVTCLEPQGAFYCFPSFEGVLGREIAGRTPTTTLELCELLLEEAKVAIVPGEAFGAPGYARLSFALADDALGRGRGAHRQAAHALASCGSLLRLWRGWLVAPSRPSFVPRRRGRSRSLRSPSQPRRRRRRRAGRCAADGGQDRERPGARGYHLRRHDPVRRRHHRRLATAAPTSATVTFDATGQPTSPRHRDLQRPRLAAWSPRRSTATRCPRPYACAASPGARRGRARRRSSAPSRRRPRRASARPPVPSRRRWASGSSTRVRPRR